MKEKIEWYREVLELEPNSKVFFPLARMLAEDGQEQEALAVLEHGLKRHPEFLEARLYYIELLYANGDKSVCSEQVSELSRMFASYAGFWNAWAACLSQKPEDADTASILRFLAANFISGPLQLHEVIDRGLASVIAEARKSPQPQTAPVISENSVQTEEAPLDNANIEPEEIPGPEVAAESDITSAEIHFAETASDENAFEDGLIAAFESDAVSAPAEIADTALPPDAFDENPNVPDAGLSAAEMTETLPEPLAELPEDAESADIHIALMDEGLPEAESLPGQDALAMESEPAPVKSSGMNEFEDSFGAMIDTLAAQAENLENQALADTADESEIIANPEMPNLEQANLQQTDEIEPADSVPEAGQPLAGDAFSLRTRSMAEVLAEQGDVAGALDIYRELAARCEDQRELDDINQRISTLNGKIDKTEEGYPEADDRSSNKEKLISMLEALAQRVEARVQN